MWGLLLLAVCRSASVTAYNHPLLQSPFNIAGRGWQTFEYGERHTEAFQAFSAVSKTPIILRITDTAQPGTSFRVVDNDLVVLITPIPKIQLGKKPTSNPLRAYNSDAWSHGQVVLSRGYHHLRVFTRSSPWHSGFGALVAEPAQKCRHTAGRYFLVRNLVGWDEAREVCLNFGADLGDPLKCQGMSPQQQSRRHRQVLQLILACGGRGDSVWIKGYRDPAFPDEDEFPASMQAINEQESVTGAEWEATQLATLCQYRR